jgi:hypothetical protein|tara:strand:- start:333 stop:581 length:249 start_codon:yes stop_codon:yes gene_type:complete
MSCDQRRIFLENSLIHAEWLAFFQHALSVNCVPVRREIWFATNAWLILFFSAVHFANAGIIEIAKAFSARLTPSYRVTLGKK